jgi:hypothetical protein
LFLAGGRAVEVGEKVEEDGNEEGELEDERRRRGAREERGDRKERLATDRGSGGRKRPRDQQVKKCAKRLFLLQTSSSFQHVE